MEDRCEIRSADGKLLCVYIISDECIEIVRRGRKFRISIERLRDDLDRRLNLPFVIAPDDE